MPVHHDVFLSRASAGEPAAEGPAREALAPRLDERHPPRPIVGAAHRKKPGRRSRIAWAVALVLALGGAQTGCRNRTGDAAADKESPASSLEPILPIEEGGAVGVAFGSESKTPAAGHLGIPAGGVIVTNAVGRQLRADELPPPEGPFGRDMRPGLQPDLLKDEPLPGREGRIADPAVGGMRQSAEPLLVAEGRVGGVAYSPDGKTLFAGYGGRGDFRRRRTRPAADFSGVVLWDAAARRRLADAPLPVREGFVTNMALSPDGKALAAGYGRADGTGFAEFGGVVLWDAAARRRLADAPLPVREDFVRGVVFGPDWQALEALAVNSIGLVGGPVGAVLRDLAARRDLVDDPSRVKECAVECVAFSPDGKTLAASYGLVGAPRDDSGGVVLWDTVTRRRLADIPLVVKEGFVRGVAFSPDGKTLAAGYIGVAGRVGGVVLWDAAARRRLADDPVPVEEGGVRGVAFSPDGKTLAAGYGGRYNGNAPEYGGVVLWDTVTRRRLADVPLLVEEGDVDDVAFSPDGKTLAAGYARIGGGSGMVLWDVAARKRMAHQPLPVRLGVVRGLAFSPDGKTLATGYGIVPAKGDGQGNGGGVILWDAPER